MIASGQMSFEPFKQFDEIKALLDILGAEITRKMESLDKEQANAPQLFNSLFQLRQKTVEAALALAEAYKVTPTKSDIDTHYGRIGVIRRKLDEVSKALEVQAT